MNVSASPAPENEIHGVIASLTRLPEQGVRTAAVALSGGVDSAVTAFLLKKAGLHVIAFHMQLSAEEEGLQAAVLHARRLADRIGIPVETLSVVEPFRTQVLAYFAREYAAGRTPNPCVVCNPRIKFGLLMDRARAVGADCLATGHYARVLWSRGADPPRLLKGIDRRKDQAYFLHRVDPERLRRVVLPLGRLVKDQVVATARVWGLSELVSKESQEFCFLGTKDYRAFLEEPGLPLAPPGPFVDQNGAVLGEHKGIHRYTVGQRRGLNLPSTEPYYVTAIEAETNRVVLGRKQDVFKKEFPVKDVRWIRAAPPAREFACHVQIRYRHKQAPARVRVIGDNTVRVVFETAQAAITPGQAAVFYQEDEVLGGGWIEGPVR